MAAENNNNSVWDYNSLKKVYLLLKNKTRTEMEEKEFLLLESILNGATCVDGISFVDNISFKDAFQHETYTVLVDYFDYLDVIFDFYDMSDENLQFKSYEKLNTDPKVLMSTAHDFFKGLNDEWYRLFLNIYNEKNSSVTFTELRSFSTYFPSANYWLANISKHNTIQDYVDTIHEYAHAIADQMNKEVKTYSSNNILIELFPITCQMIWLYECDDNGLQHELTKYINNYFKIMYDYAEEIRFKYNIASTFYNVSSARNLSRLIKKEWGFKMSPSEIQEEYKFPVQELFSYVYPFIVSLELLEIYKQDKDKFVSIMNEIILTNKSPIEILNEKNIEPTKSLNKK